mgnify:CR=1 FL=1
MPFLWFTTQAPYYYFYLMFDVKKRQLLGSLRGGKGDPDSPLANRGYQLPSEDRGDQHLKKSNLTAANGDIQSQPKDAGATSSQQPQLSPKKPADYYLMVFAVAFMVILLLVYLMQNFVLVAACFVVVALCFGMYHSALKREEFFKDFLMEYQYMSQKVTLTQQLHISQQPTGLPPESNERGVFQCHIEEAVERPCSVDL